MKKVAVMIENMFDEQELIYPYHRLREDYEVVLVGTEGDKAYESKSGYKHKSDIAAEDAKAEDFDGLYIPGGFSPDYMRRNKATLEFVKAMDEKTKPIAAICHGAWLLASAADIEGEDITSFPSIQDDLKHAGAKWVDQEVVVSNNHVTSRSPKDLPVHVKEFIKLIEG